MLLWLEGFQPCCNVNSNFAITALSYESAGSNPVIIIPETVRIVQLRSVRAPYFLYGLFGWRCQLPKRRHQKMIAVILGKVHRHSLAKKSENGFECKGYRGLTIGYFRIASVQLKAGKRSINELSIEIPTQFNTPRNFRMDRLDHFLLKENDLSSRCRKDFSCVRGK